MQFFTTIATLSFAAFALAAPAADVESRQNVAVIRFVNNGQIQNQRVPLGQQIDTNIQADTAKLRTNGVTCELLINQSSNTVDLAPGQVVDLAAQNVRVVSVRTLGIVASRIIY